MSEKDWLEQLEKFGTGWRGWTPDQVDEMYLRRLILARDGMLEMLKAMFGGPEPTTAQAIQSGHTPETAISPEKFDNMFG